MEVSKTQLIAHHVWVAAGSFTKLSILYLRSAGDPSHSQVRCSNAWLSHLRCGTKFSQKNDCIHWCSKFEDKAKPDTSGITELKIYCLLLFSHLCLDWAHSGATPDQSAAPGAPETPEADSGFRTRFKSSLAVSGPWLLKCRRKVSDESSHARILQQMASGPRVSLWCQAGKWGLGKSLSEAFLFGYVFPGVLYKASPRIFVPSFT